MSVLLCTSDGVSQREVAGRIDDEFCGWPVNVGVAGRYPLAAESSAVLDSVTGHVPTSLGVLVYANSTTLLVGTAAGQLLKVRHNLSSCRTVARTLRTGLRLRFDCESTDRTAQRSFDDYVTTSLLHCGLNKQAVRVATQYASAPCKLIISSYLFARWHCLFRHVGYLRHQQQVDL